MQLIFAGPLALNLIAGTFVFAIAARIYVWPHLTAKRVVELLTPILLFHLLRHLGLMFLAPGATLPGMPAAFSRPAAYGDLVAAGLALIALGLLRLGRPSTRAALWVFNLVGTADLLAAIALAVAHGAEPFMGATYWIPALWVPALLVTHGVVFVVLVRRGLEFSQPTAVQSGRTME